MRLIVTAVLCLMLGSFAHAQPVTVAPTDTTTSVIVAQKGKRVTLRLRGGEELSGTVRDATDRLVVLGGLAGREFFDAVIPLEAVEAVIIRTRQ